jgi:hypothetical protein
VAKSKTSNGLRSGGQSKMEAVRNILKKNQAAMPGEITQQVKEQFGIDITPKMASTYKYHIQRKAGKRRGGCRWAQAETTGNSVASGLDDLLRAADKLGWQRVKEVVDKVIQAPA